jgi:hypothetical protein
MSVILNGSRLHGTLDWSGSAAGLVDEQRSGGGKHEE